jgi:hypothetical protein
MGLSPLAFSLAKLVPAAKKKPPQLAPRRQKSR